MEERCDKCKVKHDIIIHALPQPLMKMCVDCLRFEYIVRVGEVAYLERSMFALKADLVSKE